MFIEAAALGSFSAAARRLGRSQSTVSEAICSLEADLGLELFDRSGRLPILTEAGRQLEAQARLVLDAQDRLSGLANRLREGYEQRTTLVVSDTYQSDSLGAALAELDRKHPDFELEFLIAEGLDVISLVRSGRAQVGLVESQDQYPPDIRVAKAVDAEDISVFVSGRHALAELKRVTPGVLQQHRELRLNCLFEEQSAPCAHRMWSAPSYLMLMDMVGQGFGWAALPKSLVQRYGADLLKELKLPGWPRNVPVDAVWSRNRPLGQIGQSARVKVLVA